MATSSPATSYSEIDFLNLRDGNTKHILIDSDLQKALRNVRFKSRMRMLDLTAPHGIDDAGKLFLLKKLNDEGVSAVSHLSLPRVAPFENVNSALITYRFITDRPSSLISLDISFVYQPITGLLVTAICTCTELQAIRMTDPQQEKIPISTLVSIVKHCVKLTYMVFHADFAPNNFWDMRSEEKTLEFLSFLRESGRRLYIWPHLPGFNDASTELSGYTSWLDSITSKEHLASSAGNLVCASFEPSNGDKRVKDEGFKYWELNKIRAATISPRSVSGCQGSIDGRPLKIAILDSGIDTSHSRFVGKIENCISYVDFEHVFSDPTGHGTHCAGIILEIAPAATLLIAKVLRNNPTDAEPNDLKWIAKGLHWAIEHGANIISMSFNYLEYHREIDKLLLAADNADIILVNSAANEGQRHVHSVGFPARHGHLICVGSHGSVIQSDSSSAGQHVDFLAPGEHIYSTFPPDTYAWMSGTSMAAPFVSGLAAIVVEYVWINYQIQLTTCQVKQIIGKMCTRVGSHDEKRGSGFIKPMKLFKHDRIGFRRECEGIF